MILIEITAPVLSQYFSFISYHKCVVTWKMCLLVFGSLPHGGGLREGSQGLGCMPAGLLSLLGFWGKGWARRSQNAWERERERGRPPDNPNWSPPYFPTPCQSWAWQSQTTENVMAVFMKAIKCSHSYHWPLMSAWNDGGASFRCLAKHFGIHDSY